MKIDLSGKPANYILCGSEDCPRRTTCLHRLAYDSQPELESALFYTPRRLQATAGACPHYADATPQRFARGFKCVYNDLPVGLAGRLRTRLLADFGAYNYYRYLRGEFLLPPERQEHICRTAAELGADRPIVFTDTVDCLRWGDGHLRASSLNK